jgi:hypothetical protein
MGIGAIYYALKASEQLPKHSVLKQGLFGIISWIVFTSTIVHGVTLPTFLLGSNVHPALHPKFLIRGGSGEEVQETESETEELPETMERAGLLSPLHDVLVRYGAISGEDPEHRDLDVHAPRHLPDTDEGTPITRGRLHKILTEHADEVDEHAIEGGHSTKRGGQGRLNERQKSILFGEGSGLEEWDQSEDIIVYDEGDVLILTTEDGEWVLPAVVKGPRIYASLNHPAGHVATRRIVKRKGRAKNSQAQA